MGRLQMFKRVAVSVFAVSLVGVKTLADDDSDTPPMPPQQSTASNDAEQKCKEISNRYAMKWANSTAPGDEAEQKCVAAKKQEEDKFNKDSKKAKEDLDLTGEDSQASVKAACEAIGKMDEQITNLQKRYLGQCKTAFEKAAQEYDNTQREFQGKIASLPNCESSDEARMTLQMLKSGFDGTQKNLQNLGKDYKTSVAKLDKNSDQVKTCQKVTCSGSDCGKEKSESASHTTNVEDTDDSSSRTTVRKKSSSTTGMGGLMNMAAPLMMAAMQLLNTPQTTSPAMTAQATDLSSSSCLLPENFSNTACKCYLTGDCRNAEANAPTVIAAMPGSGGALLQKPDTKAADLSLGGSQLQMPAMPPRNEGGGAPGGGGYGGGGGGFGGGGGGGPRSAEGNGGAHPRSGLSADILQGVRSGTNAMGGLGNRSHPGFSDSEERGPRRKAFLTNTPTDLKQFMPTIRETASSAQPIAVSGQTTDTKTPMHSADSNLFLEMRKFHQDNWSRYFILDF